MEEVLKYDIDNNSTDKLKEYGFKEGFNRVCNQKYYYVGVFCIYEDGAIVTDITYITGLLGEMFEIPSIILDLFKDGLIIKSESLI